jgi:hypothetical protein
MPPGAEVLAVAAVDYGPAGKAGYGPLPASRREVGRILEPFGLPPSAGLRGTNATRARLLERGRPLAEKAVKLGAGSKAVSAAQKAARRADTRLWGAFVLSGTGRIYPE